MASHDWQPFYAICCQLTNGFALKSRYSVTPCGINEVFYYEEQVNPTLRPFTLTYELIGRPLWRRMFRFAVRRGGTTELGF